jgi:predicted transposase YdaD
MHQYNKGLEEGLIKTARNALLKGLSVETISEITGLSIETIRAVRGGEPKGA